MQEESTCSKHAAKMSCAEGCRTTLKPRYQGPLIHAESEVKDKQDMFDSSSHARNKSLQITALRSWNSWFFSSMTEVS